jgi:nitric oxide reductase large subunit
MARACSPRAFGGVPSRLRVLAPALVPDETLDHFRVGAGTEWPRVSASTVSTGKPVGAWWCVGIGRFGAIVVLAALSRGDDRGPPQDVARDWLLVELSAVE